MLASDVNRPESRSVAWPEGVSTWPLGGDGVLSAQGRGDL